jgi:hypothetical protein
VLNNFYRQLAPLFPKQNTALFASTTEIAELSFLQVMMEETTIPLMKKTDQSRSFVTAQTLVGKLSQFLSLSESTVC